MVYKPFGAILVAVGQKVVSEFGLPGALLCMASNVMDVLEVSTMTKTAQATAGYTALREDAAWLDLSGRGKIRATGEDRARLLHAMTTNQVETLQPGEGCYAFFLNAQGRILADVNLLCFEDHFLLDTEPETRTKVYEHLDRYIIADDVTLEDQTEPDRHARRSKGRMRAPRWQSSARRSPRPRIHPRPGVMEPLPVWTLPGEAVSS